MREKERERKKTRIIQLSESREHSQLSGDGATEGIAAKITFTREGENGEGNKYNRETRWVLTGL